MPHSARMVLALPLTFVKRCGLSSKRTLEAEQRMQTGFRAICQKKTAASRSIGPLRSLKMCAGDSMRLGRFVALQQLSSWSLYFTAFSTNWRGP